MLDDCFARLTPETFLQSFVSQSFQVGGRRGCSQCGTRGSYVEEIGLCAAGFFEAAYRLHHGIDKELDVASYANLIISLKNKIGGNFSRTSSEPNVVRVRNTRCPFGDSVRQAPELCQMTSSVFGGIAAGNFGYAKVVLDKRIAVGDNCCEVRIFLDPKHGKEVEGDEYHKEKDVVRGNHSDTEISAEIEKRMIEVWCGKIPSKSTREERRPMLVAKSSAMRKALSIVGVVAPTMATVLITGETGVGKEVIARAVHAMSDRYSKEFVAVNCGAISESLIESVLFGHERGAFTGAHDVHHGLFERADRGTLFLDEIDSLPLGAQVRLLRVLQEKEFERVGGEHTLKVDVRIIVATGQPLEQLIKEGRFREDLYYRLNVVPIHLPPLRHRPEDIPDLVVHILERLSRQYGRAVRSVSSSATTQLLAYGWPGNVRELENVLERSFLFSTDDFLDVVLIQGDGNEDPSLPEKAAKGVAENSEVPLKEAKKRAADLVEELVLRENLRRFDGNITQVARHLGLSRRAIHQKLNVHSLDASSYRAR